jgi:restriction endonuclease Mrr
MQAARMRALRELCLAIQAARASGGYLLTGGEFTRETRELARSARIALIDGQSIVDWLRSPKSAAAATAPRAHRELAPIS